MRLRTTAISALIVTLAACGAGRTLVSRSGSVPAGLDLSGNWVLSSTSGTNQRAANETLVYAFFESGKSVKLTQTDSGLFVSFDRSIVEEYRFGENREISVGPIDAMRVSGWEGSTYVVETLDDDDALLTDSYRLQNDGRQLLRKVMLLKRNDKLLDLALVYDRVLE